MYRDDYEAININRAKFSIADFTPRANCFDHYIRTSPRHKIERAIIELGHIDKSHKILDLACGTGFFLKSLRPSMYKCGVDICQSMLLKIPEECKSRRVRAHACALPFREGFFDIVTCLGAINVFDDNEIGLLFSEVKHVLNDSGKFIIDASVPLSAPRWQDSLLHKIIYPPIKAHASVLSSLYGCSVKIIYVERDFSTLCDLFKKYFNCVTIEKLIDHRRPIFDPNSHYGLIMGSN